MLIIVIIIEAVKYYLALQQIILLTDDKNDNKFKLLINVIIDESQIQIIFRYEYYI